MRKSSKLIAGLGVVAGLGVALAPLGAFADVATPTRTDVIRFTNSEACTVNNVALDGTTVDLYNYYDGEVTPGNVVTLDATKIVDASDPETSATEQVFTIKCNSATGYRVVANATNPTGQDANNTSVTVPAGTAIDGNTSFWAAQVTATGNLTSTNGANFFAINASNQKVASNAAGSAAAGDSFTVAYKIGAANALKAGRYEGQVVYTIIKSAD